jgi:hypothetical protein
MQDVTVDSFRWRVNMADVQSDFNCKGDCTWVFEDFIRMPNWSCDGGPNISRQGNWQGHVFPGCIFLFWSTHWLVAWARKAHESRFRGEPYQSTATLKLLGLVPWPLEAWVKTVLPPFYILLELWLAHEGGYRRLVCPSGTAREGRFTGNHVNNWMHSGMMVGFSLSGVVDLVFYFVRDPALPQSLPLTMLSLAYLCEGILMGMHKKHSPLDVSLHWLLTFTMVMSSVACLLEAVFLKGHAMLTGLRIFAVALQGSWFIAVARILYEKRPAWDEGRDTDAQFDLSPVLSSGMLFLQLSLGLIMLISTVYLTCYLAYRKR